MSTVIKTFGLGLILITGYLVSSCVSSEVAESKDVNQQQIFLKYYVTIDAESNNTEIEAIFRFGGSKGTSLTLSEPSKIKVNGKDMKGKTKLLSGYLYEHSFKGITDTNFEFIFTDTGNKSYSNKYIINPISLSNLSDSISKTGTDTFIWHGNPIDKFEQIELILTDNTGKSIDVNNSIKGSASIIVSPENLKELATGIINLRIIRSINSHIENAPEIGGQFYNSYKSKVYSIKLVN